ncbi:MAG: hypothetical protein HYT70_02625 [Candidatus Aenigmarchaeota archaeon]|nr:hypothetical protein [Candidatus Aenigmarchaeota archaeon]
MEISRIGIEYTKPYIKTEKIIGDSLEPCAGILQQYYEIPYSIFKTLSPAAILMLIDHLLSQDFIRNPYRQWVDEQADEYERYINPHLQ